MEDHVECQDWNRSLTNKLDDEQEAYTPVSIELKAEH